MEGKRQYSVVRPDLISPELSFKINGILFSVHNTLGGSLQEKYYQKAVAAGLEKEKLYFQEQYYVPLRFGDKIIGKYFLDFLIEEKIILELKRGRYLPVNVFNQTQQYLTSLHLPLAIVACFGYDAVVIKRIVNHNHVFVNSKHS